MTAKKYNTEHACEIDLLRTWDQIAEFLGVHRETAQRWGRTKGLPYARLMDRIVISTKEIIRLWKNGEKDFGQLIQSVDPVSCAVIGHEISPHVDLEKMAPKIVVGWEQIGSILGLIS